MIKAIKPYLKYLIPAAAVGLSFGIQGVIGWFVLWGGVFTLALLGASYLAQRLIPVRVQEKLITVVITAAGFLAVVLIALIFIFIFKEGVGVFGEVSLKRIILGTIWQPMAGVPKYGILPLIVSTGVISILSLAVAVPLGLAAAIFLSEIATKSEREFLKPVVELLGAIPSVVYGLLGMVVLGDIIPRLTGTPFRLSGLNGALVLAVMLTPMLVSLAEDALYAVPKEYRTAAAALGATRWETIRRVVIPAASSGVAAAVLLSLARTIGETMAVLLATGNMSALTFNPLQSMRTLTATIAIEMGEAAFGTQHYKMLFALSIILFSITFVVNLAADAILARAGRRFKP